MNYSLKTPKQSLELADQILSLPGRYEVAIALIKIHDEGVLEGLDRSIKLIEGKV